MSSEKPKLTALEKAVLEQLIRRGYRLVPPGHKPSKATLSLVGKGYVRKLPGLLDETPQGYAPAEQ